MVMHFLGKDSGGLLKKRSLRPGKIAHDIAERPDGVAKQEQLPFERMDVPQRLRFRIRHDNLL